MVDAENQHNPACSAFFADAGFDVCEVLRKRRKDGGADVITE
jgi:hypothetical protein